MKSFVFLIWALTWQPNSSGTSPPDNICQQSTLPNNPGQYYDKIDLVRSISKRWRLMLSIDLRNLLGNPLPGLKNTQTFFNDCIQHLDEQNCFNTLGYAVLNDYSKELQHMQDHLGKILGSPTTKLDKRRFNRSPRLGFIGTLSRSLFVNMDYNDQEHITKEIERLYQDQR